MPSGRLVMAAGHIGLPVLEIRRGSPGCQRRVALAPAGWMAHLVRLLRAISRPSGRRPVKARPEGALCRDIPVPMVAAVGVEVQPNCRQRRGETKRRGSRDEIGAGFGITVKER